MVESRKAYIYRTNFAKLFRGSQDGKQENLPAVLLLTFIFTLAFRVYIEFGIILDDVYNLFFIGLSTFFSAIHEIFQSYMYGHPLYIGLILP